MPTYDFACGTCGGFRVLTSIDQRNAPRSCPQCGAAAERVHVAPALALMPSLHRHAEITHEKSRHEPRLAKTAARARTEPAAAKGFPGKRPWMISH